LEGRTGKDDVRDKGRLGREITWGRGLGERNGREEDWEGRGQGWERIGEEED